MHTIRLRGPWELAVDGETPQTVRLPDDDLREFVATGRVSCSLERRFNRPSGLENEDVFLSVLLTPAAATVSLNGYPIGQTDGVATSQFSIRDRIRDHNLVRLEVHNLQGWDDSAECDCQVSIEIQP